MSHSGGQDLSHWPYHGGLGYGVAVSGFRFRVQGLGFGSRGFRGFRLRGLNYKPALKPKAPCRALAAAPLLQRHLGLKP